MKAYHFTDYQNVTQTVKKQNKKTSAQREN